ncbi:MAG: glycosyltransferase [Pseudomonadota bacterium]
MKQHSKDRLDMLYVESAGDIVKSWRDWHQGIETPEETSITFSSQVFALAREQGWSLLALSFFARQDQAEGERQTAMTRPRPFTGNGIFYYLSEGFNGLWLFWLVLMQRPRIVVVSSGACLWVSLLLLRLLPVRVIVSMHNTPWPAGFYPQSRLKRLLLWLDGLFFRHVAQGALCVSPECARQVAELSGGRGVQIWPHLPQYRVGHLVKPVREARGEAAFRIAFAGRIEADKGVFDIVQMALALRERGLPNFIFEMCGDGSALPALRLAIAEAGLSDCVITHGRLARAALVAVYGRAHLAIVPTRSDFNEGFAMVAAEAAMMGIPVLTSPVVPAAEVLGAAARLAVTNDVASYVREIALLMQDASVYEACRQGCEPVAAVFTRPEQGFKAALARACGKLEGSGQQ